MAYLAMRDIDIGKMPMLRLPIKYPFLVFSLFGSKKAKYMPINADSKSVNPNRE